MKKEEFEKYLSLLAGVLRLQSAQREAIGSELRDHLEFRLDELEEQGVPRDRAVELALEEFGDAAALAQSFGLVANYRRRRWMMRFTTFAIAGSFVFVVLLGSMWPDASRLPVTPRSNAQDDTAAGEAYGQTAGEAYGGGEAYGQTADYLGADFADVAAAPSQDAEPSLADLSEQTRERLEQQIVFEFVDVDLVDAIEYFGEMLSVQFYIDQNCDVQVADPISLSFERISGRLALELMLEPIDASYVIRDGIVIVMDYADAAEYHEVKVYNCRDLLAKLAIDGPPQLSSPAWYGGGLGGQPGGGAPGAGGFFASSPGAIRLLDPALETQQDIERGVYKTEAQDRDSLPQRSDGIARQQIPNDRPAVGDLSSKPDYDGSSAYEWGDQPYDDTKGEAAGNRRDGPYGGIRGYGPQSAPQAGGAMLGGLADGRDHRFHPESMSTDALIQIITTTIASGDWGFVGGTGQVTGYNGILVIRHKSKVHQEIQDLLEMLEESVPQDRVF